MKPCLWMSALRCDYEISSLICKSKPPPFAFLSNLQRAAYPMIWNCAVVTFVPEMKKKHEYTY